MVGGRVVRNTRANVMSIAILEQGLLYACPLKELMVYIDACAGAHCIQEAVINRDTLWAGSQVLLPILATWTSQCRTWRRIPATRSAWASLGLFYQLRCSVRFDNECNFGLTLTTFEVNDGKHIVDQLLNRVVAPELLREVGTHVGPFCKWQGANTDDLPNQGVRIEKAADWLELCQRLFPVRDEMVAGTVVVVIVGHCCGSYSPHLFMLANVLRE